MNEIKLEVGKRYKTRIGYVAEITGAGSAPSFVKPDRARLYEFAGTVTYHDGTKSSGDWRSDGVFDDTQPGNAMDIVSEIPDEQPAQGEEFTPPEFVEQPAPLRLEVGKFYRRRDGEVARIDSHDGENQFCGKNYPFWSSHGNSYLSDGTYNHLGDESQEDLIEEIPAPVAEAAAEMEFETGPVTATDGPATEKVVAHWDRERFIGIEAGASTSAGADDTWLRTNLADTRAGIARKYAQAAMFVMLGVAAIVFAIGSSVQA